MSGSKSITGFSAAVLSIAVVLGSSAAHAATRTWSGAGDGASWRDPANWEGGAVPPSDSDTCVDISRAAGRTLVLDEAKKLSCIIFNPQGSQRKATISGNGYLYLLLILNI